MRESASLVELIKALVAAQGRFPVIPKGKTAKVETKTGGGYSYKYADLEDCVSKVQPILADNGLAIIQPIESTEGGDVLLTRLMHISGEWLESTKNLPYGDNTPPQQQAAVITYLRRYTFCSLLRIVADEDTDAQGTEAAPRQRKSPTSVSHGAQREAETGRIPHETADAGGEHEAEAKRSAARAALKQLVDDGIVGRDRATEIWALYGQESEDKWFHLLSMEIQRYEHEHGPEEEEEEPAPMNITHLQEKAVALQQRTRPAPSVS